MFFQVHLTFQTPPKYAKISPKNVFIQVLLSRISALRLVKFGCQDNGAFKGPQHSAVNSFLMPLPRAHTHRSLTSDIRPLSSNLRPSIAHSDIDNHVDGPCTVEQSWVGEVVDIGEGKANPPPETIASFGNSKSRKKKNNSVGSLLSIWCKCLFLVSALCFVSTTFPTLFPTPWMTMIFWL